MGRVFTLDAAGKLCSTNCFVPGGAGSLPSIALLVGSAPFVSSKAIFTSTRLAAAVMASTTTVFSSPTSRKS